MLKTVNILLADDHAIVRKGLRALIERKPHFKVVAEAETGEEAAKMARDIHPDIAVIDIWMPGLSGIDACRQITSTVMDCKVIMLTAYAEDAMLMAAIRAGASGYVLKLASDNELIRTIERVSSGEGKLDSLSIAMVFKDLRKATEAERGAQFSTLSPQEMAVLALVTRGLTNRQIATKLFLGEDTVRNYVSRILNKLSVANRTEAAAYGTRHNIEKLVLTS